MEDAVAQWVEGNADRAQSRQRAQADAAKLVATFVAGVAATLVGTQLQVPGDPGYDKWSAILLAVSVGLAVVVILLDRLSESDHLQVLEDARVKGWDDEQVMKELRFNAVVASRDNEKVLREVRVALFAQFVCAAASGAVAALGLLG